MKAPNGIPKKATYSAQRTKATPQNVTDIDSTISTKGLMQRKLYLMKLMLRNEK